MREGSVSPRGSKRAFKEKKVKILFDVGYYTDLYHLKKVSTHAKMGSWHRLQLSLGLHCIAKEKVGTCPIKEADDSLSLNNFF